MGFIKLNLYGDASGSTLDAAAVVEKVRAKFADVKILPGDQLELGADRAAAAGAADHVVRTLRRNQQEYGPAYAFEIGGAGHTLIEGRARRYDVTFQFADPLEEDWRLRLVAFLRSLGPGRIEQAAGKDAAFMHID